MSELVRKNILKLKPYVPGKPIEEVERELKIKKVIKLASNENPLGPSKLALLSAKKYLPYVSLYPDGNCLLLKKKLAKVLNFEEDNFVLGCGSDEIIHLIALAFLNKGEEVITGTPSFVIYETNTTLMEGKIKLVPLKNFTYDLPEIKNNITPKTKIIFIANPNNPTGTIVKKDEVDDFLQNLPEKIIVVFDEAYYEYVEDKDYPQTLPYIREGKNIIVLRTFSKIYGLAGLRIGYGIGPKNLMGYLNRVREPFNVSSVAQVAARYALDDKEHIKKSRKTNAEGKKFLYREFKKLNLFFIPTEGNFIFVDTKMDAKLLFKEMLQSGVIVRSGDIFGLSTFIRVTVGEKFQNEKFIYTLKKILNREKGG